MDALLIAGWLRGFDTLRIVDQASLSEMRARIRALGDDLPATVVERLAAAGSELASNQLRHARHGEVGLRRIARAGIAGVELIAADRGPGVAGVAAALDAHGVAHPERRSLGVGIGAARRLSDEMDVDIRLGEGSCFTLRIFAEPVPRGREVAIVGRPHPSESLSGDGALVMRQGDRLLVAVADGAGHGSAARESSMAAIEGAQQVWPSGPLAMLEAAHRAVSGQRGAAMSLVDIDGARLEHAGIGNITTRVCGAKGSQGFLTRAMLLGAAGKRADVKLESAILGPHEVVLMFSDGLQSRATIATGAQWTRQPAIAIAEHMLATYGRDRDDALVAVIR